MLRDVSVALENMAQPVIVMKGHVVTRVNEATLTTFGYTVGDASHTGTPYLNNRTRLQTKLASLYRWATLSKVSPYNEIFLNITLTSCSNFVYSPRTTSLVRASRC